MHTSVMKVEWGDPTGIRPPVTNHNALLKFTF
jgi:hypothetical protein